MIEVKGLSRRYGGNKALNDLSFQVAEGEVVGFLGPNGAGKSTTMKILTCSLAPTSGTASVGGFDILDDPLAVRRQIGFMPEHVALYSDMPVRSYLCFVADLKNVPRREMFAHVDDIIEHLDRARREPDWARSIREAGHKRALSEHTYRLRLERILKEAGYSSANP